MSIFSRFFKRHAPPTALQDFIDSLSPSTCLHLASDLENESMRVPAAMSLTLLLAVGEFCQGVRQSVAELRKTNREHDTQEVAYDVIAYEAAVYVHYHLMDEYMPSGRIDDNDDYDDDDSDDDDSDDDDSDDDDDLYLDALRTSLSLTAGILGKHTSFGLSEKFFSDRVTSYGIKTIAASLRRQNSASIALEEFESNLCSALEARTPAGYNGRPILDVAVGLALKANLQLFQDTVLAGLRESVQRLYEHGDSLFQQGHRSAAIAKRGELLIHAQEEKRKQETLPVKVRDVLEGKQSQQSTSPTNGGPRQAAREKPPIPKQYGIHISELDIAIKVHKNYVKTQQIYVPLSGNGKSINWNACASVYASMRYAARKAEMKISGLVWNTISYAVVVRMATEEIEGVGMSDPRYQDLESDAYQNLDIIDKKVEESIQGKGAYAIEPIVSYLILAFGGHQNPNAIKALSAIVLMNAEAAHKKIIPEFLQDLS